MTENFINYEKPLNRNNIEKETIDFYQCFSIEDVLDAMEQLGCDSIKYSKISGVIQFKYQRSTLKGMENGVIYGMGNSTVYPINIIIRNNDVTVGYWKNFNQ